MLLDVVVGAGGLNEQVTPFVLFAGDSTLDTSATGYISWLRESRFDDNKRCRKCKQWHESHHVLFETDLRAGPFLRRTPGHRTCIRVLESIAETTSLRLLHAEVM